MYFERNAKQLGLNFLMGEVADTERCKMRCHTCCSSGELSTENEWGDAEAQLLIQISTLVTSEFDEVFPKSGAIDE